jgi:hypothetical protein
VIPVLAYPVQDFAGHCWLFSQSVMDREAAGYGGAALAVGFHQLDTGVFSA